MLKDREEEEEEKTLDKEERKKMYRNAVIIGSDIV
jgi:hypothetical protein